MLVIRASTMRYNYQGPEGLDPVLRRRAEAKEAGTLGEPETHHTSLRAFTSKTSCAVCTISL